MIVGFVGGPYDGKTAELARNCWELRVPVRRPSDITQINFVPEDEAQTMMTPSFGVGTYVFNWGTLKMHWREPRG